LIARVALDTCIGFNSEVVRALYASKIGMNINEIHTVVKIPISTLRGRLDDLEELGIIQKSVPPRLEGVQGAPMYVYYLSTKTKALWQKARLDDPTFVPQGITE
jgi:predicted ArsR family transcriptional regulator